MDLHWERDFDTVADDWTSMYQTRNVATKIEKRFEAVSKATNKFSDVATNVEIVMLFYKYVCGLFTKLQLKSTRGDITQTNECFGKIFDVFLYFTRMAYTEVRKDNRHKSTNDISHPYVYETIVKWLFKQFGHFIRDTDKNLAFSDIRRYNNRAGNLNIKRPLLHSVLELLLLIQNQTNSLYESCVDLYNQGNHDKYYNFTQLLVNQTQLESNKQNSKNIKYIDTKQYATKFLTLNNDFRKLFGLIVWQHYANAKAKANANGSANSKKTTSNKEDKNGGGSVWYECVLPYRINQIVSMYILFSNDTLSMMRKCYKYSLTNFDENQTFFNSILTKRCSWNILDLFKNSLFYKYGKDIPDPMYYVMKLLDLELFPQNIGYDYVKSNEKNQTNFNASHLKLSQFVINTQQVTKLLTKYFLQNKCKKNKHSSTSTRLKMIVDDDDDNNNNNSDIDTESTSSKSVFTDSSLSSTKLSANVGININIIGNHDDDHFRKRDSGRKKCTAGKLECEGWVWFPPPGLTRASDCR